LNLPQLLLLLLLLSLFLLSHAPLLLLSLSLSLLLLSQPFSPWLRGVAPPLSPPPPQRPPLLQPFACALRRLLPWRSEPQQPGGSVVHVKNDDNDDGDDGGAKNSENCDDGDAASWVCSIIAHLGLGARRLFCCLGLSAVLFLLLRFAT
jgi:hypothetical protein